MVTKPTQNAPYVIWTYNQLDESQKTQLLDVIANSDDAGPFGNIGTDGHPIEWIDGKYIEFDVIPDDDGAGYITVNTDESYIEFQNSASWTQFLQESISPRHFFVKNTYNPKGEYIPIVTKDLKGRDLKAGEFSFELLNEAGDVIGTSTNALDGSVMFGTIEFTLEDIGEHTYSIREVVGELGGVEYVKDPIEFTLTVSDNLDGTLKIESTLADETTFTNIYTATGEFTPVVTKVLSGRDLEKDEFKFTLVEGEKIIQEVSNLADGTIPFETIEYTLDDIGVHTYTIKEVEGTLGGVEYDPLEVTYVVSVTDGGEGELNIEYEEPKDLVFNNIYTAKGYWKPIATKDLDAGGRNLKDDEFTFELYRGEELIQTVQNLANGTIPFEFIEFELEHIGVEEFTIIEVIGNEIGMTYDTLEITYVVTVSDKGDGTLNVAYDIPEDVEFNNIYEAEGSVIFEFEKVLDGRTIKDKEFTFNLVDNEGHVLQTKQNDTQGIVLFDEISYNQDDVGKEFVYKVIEVFGEEIGMTYDETEKEIVVSVSDLGNGYLSFEVDTPENVTFVNLYRANGEVMLRGSKVLEGRILKDQEFEFQLYDAQDQLIEIVKNNAQGSFEFSALEFTQDDIDKEFVYTINEVKGSEKGMTYDETVIKVTIKVVDSNDGEFEFEIVYEQDVIFTNSYTIPKDGVVTATKEWLNKDDDHPTI